MEPALKPILFLGDSLAAIRKFPAPVRDEIGFGLYLAQVGDKHTKAKPLQSFGSGVLEMIAEDRSGTFRTIYVVRLKGIVYVLHAFQKKSKRGIATPQAELQLVRQRLKQAMELHLAGE